ncbi:MAG: hypothetical protein JNL08_04460 [Planctomycetes bacterium]|nr:hypothetical protein [Planctomycetota bacterium]
MNPTKNLVPASSGRLPGARLSARLAALFCFAVAAHGQCPEGTVAGLVPWNAGDHFASTWAVDDEGLSPLINLGFAFPMPGTAGFDAMQIGSNGEIYLADWWTAPPPPNEPVGGSSFGTNTILELRGRVLGGSARIVPLGLDQQGSQVSCNIWAVSYATPLTGGPAGEATVTWTDMARWGNAADRFSFSCRLFANGSVEFSYGAGLPLPACLVGISVGNLVNGVASNLSATPTVPTGLLYESFPAGAFDLAGQTLRIDRQGTGYTALALLPYTAPNCAFHCAYGEGCHSIGENTLFQQFADSEAVRTALTASRVTFLHDSTNEGGYTAIWGGGGSAFRGPNVMGSTAVALGGFSDPDTGSVVFTPPAFPVPGGFSGAVTVSVDGILTIAATANNAGDSSPAAADILDAVQAPALAFYSWHDFLLNDSVGSSGQVTREVFGGHLYITWDAVEARPDGVANSSSWQYQIELATGHVAIVWQSIDATMTDTGDWLVGCTLEGTGATPGAAVFDNSFPPTQLVTNIHPLTLSAAPRPVQVGTVLAFDYTIDNIPSYWRNDAPPYIAVLALSLLPAGGGGVPLGLFGMHGCSAYVANLDIVLPIVGAGPTEVVPVFEPSMGPAPLDFYAQAFALYDVPSWSPPFNFFGLLASNGVHSHVEYQ